MAIGHVVQLNTPNEIEDLNRGHVTAIGDNKYQINYHPSDLHIVLLPETLQVKEGPKHPYKVGDWVKIINPGYTYSTYERKFQEAGFNNLKYNDIPDRYQIGKIFWVGFHEINSIPLIAIETADGKQCLMGADGAELATPKEIEESTLFKKDDWVVCLPGFTNRDEGDYILNKKGNYAGKGYVSGKVFKVREYTELSKVLWPMDGGNGIYNFAVRKATPREIEATKTKIFKIGDQQTSVTVSKNKISAEGFTISAQQLEDFIVASTGSVSGTDWIIKVKTVDIGCTKNVKISDLEDILDFYESIK